MPLDGATWDLSCKDWEQRLREGRSLVPDLPGLDVNIAARAVGIFNKLTLYDVIGKPAMADVAGDWWRDILRAVFGSIDVATGIRRVRGLFCMVPKKNAKSVSLDTPIATPTGFTTMGAVAVGDLVLDPEGCPTRVTEKSNVFLGRPCFDVVFSTGEAVTCDAEHLWVTDAHADRQRQPKSTRHLPQPSPKTTEDIAATLTVSNGRINNHRTALCRALELPSADLPIPPYVLGYWLGNGSTGEAVVTAGAEDAEHVVTAMAGASHSAAFRGYYPSGAARISIAEPARPRDRLCYRFRTAARRLGVLRNKHVPMLYLRASIEQRLALLRGLMDSDGTISKAGQATYTTTSPQLRDDVRELINTLGFKASIREWPARLNGKDYGPAWGIQFWPFDETQVFTLPRKLARQRVSQARNAPRSRTRQIVDVRPCPSVPVQCLAVESESHQFLVTRSLIPTHNTTNAAGLMLTALILNKRPSAEMLLTGPSQEISDKGFNTVRGMINNDGVLQKRFHVANHIKTITDRTNDALLKVKTFDEDIVTGAVVTAAAIDEIHLLGRNARASWIIQQLRGGMVTVPEALFAMITTQSFEPPAGVFADELKIARAIRDGGAKTVDTLPVLYEFTEAQQKDRTFWEDPANWHLVTPNLNRSIRIPRLVMDFEEARLKGERDIRIWASQHLNIEVGLALHSERWRGADHWEAATDVTLVDLAELLRRSEVVTMGGDGGGLDDLLGLAVMGREKVTRRRLLWAHGWVHDSVLKLRQSEAPLFEGFAAAGELTLYKTLGEDLDEVTDYVEQVVASGLLPDKEAVGVDPVGLGGLVEALIAGGVTQEQIVGISQGWRLSGAIMTAERALADGTLVHGGQKLMAYCVGNAKIEPRGSAKLITKQGSGVGKIDPLLAALNAISLMERNPEAQGAFPDDYEVKVW